MHVMTQAEMVDVVADAATPRDRRRRLHVYLAAIVDKCSQPPAVTLLVLCSTTSLDEQVPCNAPRPTVTRACSPL